jgi:sulfoxide reductase heme-binding subunit YedZ
VALLTPTRALKAVVFLACLAPIGWLAWQLHLVLSGADPLALTVDPAKAVLHTTGQDTIVLLFITLLVTPIRRLSGWNRIQSVRRLLGVWTFVYALAHVSAYLAFDRNCIAWATCDLEGIGKDLTVRPFIIAGLVAFTILLALAATSTNAAVRRLKRQWQRLHRLVYLAAAAAVTHYLWIQKSDIHVPLRWAYGFGALLLIRLWFAWNKRRPLAASGAN